MRLPRLGSQKNTERTNRTEEPSSYQSLNGSPPAKRLKPGVGPADNDSILTVSVSSGDDSQSGRSESSEATPLHRHAPALNEVGDDVSISIEELEADAALQKLELEADAALQKKYERIEYLKKCGVKEKTVWSDRYGKDRLFKERIDRYVEEVHQLNLEIDAQIVSPGAAVNRATAIMAHLYLAFGFIDENGYTDQIQKDLKEAGAFFADGSITSNWLGQSISGGRYFIVSLIYFLFKDQKPEKTPALAFTLAGLNILYAYVQTDGVLKGPFLNAGLQSETGKKQNFLESPLWPNVLPARPVDRDNQTLLPDRAVLERRIKELKNADETIAFDPVESVKARQMARHKARLKARGTAANFAAASSKPVAIGEVYTEIVRDLSFEIKRQERKIADCERKYKTNPAKFGPKIARAEKLLENLKKSRQDYQSSYGKGAPTKKQALYRLEMQLAISKLYGNINAAWWQGVGKAVRSGLNGAVPLLALAKTAGSWAGMPFLSNSVYNVTLFAFQLAQAGAYSYYHGKAAGLDALDKLTTVGQICTLSAIGDFGKPGEVKPKLIDKYGRGPLANQLDSVKKLVEFDAQNLVQAMLAHLADENGDLPGGKILSEVNKDLRKLNEGNDRIKYLTDLRADLLKIKPNLIDSQGSVVDVDGPTQKILDLYRKRMSDLSWSTRPSQAATRASCSTTHATCAQRTRGC